MHFFLKTGKPPKGRYTQNLLSADRLHGKSLPCHGMSEVPHTEQGHQTPATPRPPTALSASLHTEGNRSSQARTRLLLQEKGILSLKQQQGLMEVPTGGVEIHSSHRSGPEHLQQSSFCPRMSHIPEEHSLEADTAAL